MALSTANELPADVAATLPGPGGLLTAPNGRRYRVVVANDGTLGTVPADALPDPDAAAFITAAGLADGAAQQALHALVRALKAHGIWPRLHALYPMVGGTARAHALNLKDPRDTDAAYRLAFVGNPRHTGRGVEWDGSQHADTHYHPQQHLHPTSSHLAYYAVTDSTVGTQVEMGCHGDAYLGLLMQLGSQTCYESCRPTQFTAPVSDGRGFGLGSRETGTAATLYRDGRALTGTVSGGATPGSDYPDASLWLGGRQDGFRTRKACGLASFGDGLTPAQAVTYAVAVAAFQLALGRAAG